MDLTEAFRTLERDYIIDEGLSPKQKMHIRTLLGKEFNQITDPTASHATYVTPAGKIWDTKGSKFEAQHSNVADYLSKELQIDDLDSSNGSSIMRKGLNAARVTYWPGVMQSVVIPPAEMTEEQQEVLRRFISKLRISKSNPFVVSAVKPGGSPAVDVVTAEFTQKLNPKLIVDSIMQYYVDGKLYGTEDFE